ncbi:MAG: SH3 domain-containing protein [Sulfurimonas sp.]|jgi:hypothetical protein|nr:SH3 domain-containing protein [Sulfurimonas sp.]
MKKSITILLIVLLQSLYGYSEEIESIIDASFIDTGSKKIPNYQQKSNKGTLKIIFKKGDVITYEENSLGRVEFSKQNIKGSLEVGKKMIAKTITHANFFDETLTIYGQQLNIVSCINEKNDIILAVVLNYMDSSRTYPQYIRYKAQIYIIHNDSYKAIAEKDNVLSLENYWNNIIVDSPDSNKNPYPYYNEAKILKRLYETGTCDKEATEEANIQVLVGDKWIPQEESWNIKETIADTITKTILQKKQPLYKSPSIDSKTKMYLIKGDKVEILEEKDNWLHILYKGKKEIKAWIPKDAVEH